MHIIGLGEAFLLHQSTIFQYLVRVEKAIGSNQLNLAMLGPATEQSLQNTRSRTFTDGDAASNANNIRNAMPLPMNHTLCRLLIDHINIIIG